MPDPQPLAQQHPTEVWAALAGAVTLVLGLIAVIYNNMKQNTVDLWKEISQLRTQGKDCEIRQGQLKTEIDHLKTEDQSIYEELDRLDDGHRASDKRLTTLEAEHNSCIPRRLAMKGMQQP